MKTISFFSATCIAVMIMFSSCNTDHPLAQDISTIQTRSNEKLELNAQGEIVFFDEELDNPEFDLLNKSFILYLTQSTTNLTAGVAYVSVKEASRDEAGNLLLTTQTKFDLNEGSLLTDLTLKFEREGHTLKVTTGTEQSIINGTKRYQDASGEIIFEGFFDETNVNVGTVSGLLSVSLQ